MSKPIIKVRNLRKAFPITRGLLIPKKIGEIVAVDGITFDIHEGETLGCVGGSGSGKSTIGRLILNLMQPDGGSVEFQGENISAMTPTHFRPYRRHFQIIFQDPLQSLNPRRTIAENIAVPLLNFNYGKKEAYARVEELLATVGLDSAHGNRYPHQFSGGQCQRIGIARALALQPKFLFLDEPVSALDVSIQAQILNLLQELQEKFNLTYLFVANDLKTVKHISDRIIILYQGKIVEVGPGNEIYNKPLHPFAQGFLKSVLHMESDSTWKDNARAADNTGMMERGESVASAAAARQGCIFYEGCAKKTSACRRTEPAMAQAEKGHYAACHLYQDGDNP